MPEELKQALSDFVTFARNLRGDEKTKRNHSSTTSFERSVTEA